MEPHTDALEIVCKHFRQEYGTEAMAVAKGHVKQLRREKHCLSSQNYRLRKKVDVLNVHIADLEGRHDRLLRAHRKLVVQMHRARAQLEAFARESLSVTLPYL